jgi:hypothetical protein
MVQPVAEAAKADHWGEALSPVTICLTGRTAPRLGGGGESGREPGRIGCPAVLHPPGHTLWPTRVAEAYSHAAGSGVVLASARPAKEA